MRHSLILLLLTLALRPAGRAQEKVYPQGYFRNPLDIPILLAGNFGECRPGHFHSGIDIKTLGRENLPVFAAAEGYVSRIKTEPGGFGHALYITHPNGFTTLYAHLNDFVPRLQRYLRQEQYRQERWNLDLNLSPDQFPVSKGEQIAWSGNTGGSTAPHLHFEIRNTQSEHPLNPQLFGFDVQDTLPPVAKTLGLYLLGQSIYDALPQCYPLQRRAGRYAPAQDTLFCPAGFVGLGLETDDYMNASANTLNFYTATWSVGDSLLGRIRLDDIGYDETRYLHAYADYRMKELGNPWMQCLFRLPGNRLAPIYENLRHRSPAGHEGVLILRAGDRLPVRIQLRDALGNTSQVEFVLCGTDSPPPVPRCTSCWKAGQAVKLDHQTNLRLQLDERALYDDLCEMITTGAVPADAYAPIVTIQRPELPVHTAFQLSVRPTRPVPFALRNKMILVYSDGRKETGKAAIAEDQGWYRAAFRNFGSFRLQADTTGPVLRPQGLKSGVITARKSVRIEARDAGSSIASFRGTIDGRWVLFEQAGSTWTYLPDDRCPKGRHELQVTVQDESGNATTRSYTVVR
jgi:hypothetical protein